MTSKIDSAEDVYFDYRINRIYKNLKNNYTIETIEKELINVIYAFGSNYVTDKRYYLRPAALKKFKVDPRLEVNLLPTEHRGRGVKYILEFDNPWWKNAPHRYEYYNEEDLFLEMAKALNRIRTKTSWKRVCKKCNLLKVDYVLSFGEFVESCVNSLGGAK